MLHYSIVNKASSKTAHYILYRKIQLNHKEKEEEKNIAEGATHCVAGKKSKHHRSLELIDN